MKVDVRYSKMHLEVEVPDENLMAVCRLKPVPPLDDPKSAVEIALDNPIGTQPLRELAKGKESACVVVCDKTRPVPNSLILPPLLRRLEEAGIKREKITVLIATGTHRPNLGDELVEMLGEFVVDNYRIENHIATDIESHADLGWTSTGMPILLDRRYVKADLKIVVGLIEPHLMAGYSGGRKVVCPGIIAMPCMKIFHGAEFMGHPNSVTGVLEGNPVHLTAMEVANKAGCDFAVHVTLDEQRRITGVFAGNVHETFFAGVQLVDKVAKVPVPEPADIVITSSAGYPLDTTFYQAIKGLVGVMPILKRGSTVILAASLAEGLGLPRFREIYTEFQNWDEFKRLIYSPDYFREDQWMVQEQMKVAEIADIWVYSDGVSPEELELAKVKPLGSLQEGLEQALKKHGSKAKVVVVPEGPYVMPVVNHSAN
ncbi:MAG: nickel-dependent lactate racemase [Armatimonadetes bacterium]|nr:nickel-dependent lactate racemase [Armatimonadota bacterium]MDW8027721.1 nickel-dependent lactate racemase [Armatimonadota bacterium]